MRNITWLVEGNTWLVEGKHVTCWGAIRDFGVEANRESGYHDIEKTGRCRECAGNTTLFNYVQGPIQQTTPFFHSPESIKRLTLTWSAPATSPLLWRNCRGTSDPGLLLGGRAVGTLVLTTCMLLGTVTTLSARGTGPVGCWLAELWKECRVRTQLLERWIFDVSIKSFVLFGIILQSTYPFLYDISLIVKSKRLATDGAFRENLDLGLKTTQRIMQHFWTNIVTATK